MHYLNEIINVLKSKNVGMLGCSNDEILSLEKKLNVSLPLAYKEYLLKMGKYSGVLFRGTDCFYEHLLYLKPLAEELLEENGLEIKLPSNSFVFSSHQGYQFNFFQLDDNQNPPVYFFSEGQKDLMFQLIAPSFTEYLKTALTFFKIN